MQILIDISKDRYDEIMSMDWKNCRRFFDEEIRAIHDGKALVQQPSSPENPNKWIPVKTALPDKNMRCLVAVGRFNYTQIATYSDLMGTIDHRIFFRGDNEHGNFEDITQYVKAWMPLPKAYEGDAE